MLFKSGIPVLTVMLAAGSAIAQQASTVQTTPARGAIVFSTPHSAINRGPVAVPVQRRKPSCDAPADRTSVVPEMVFSRMMDDLVCLRHSDGSSELLFGGA
jgi:hypothetical protein